MTLYRVTTTFSGADGHSQFYFDTKEKAENFLLSECENGEIQKCNILARYSLNYNDGCSLDDLTYGVFDAEVIEIKKVMN